MTSLLAILHKLARISYNLNTKLEIHKVVFLVLLCIFLSKNLYSYAKNTEEFKNGIKFLIKKNAEVPVFDPGMSSPNPNTGKKGSNLCRIVKSDVSHTQKCLYFENG